MTLFFNILESFNNRVLWLRNFRLNLLVVRDVSRLFFLITSGGLLGTTEVTVMEKSRLRRKYYQSSRNSKMEQFSRLIIWKHLGR